MTKLIIKLFIENKPRSDIEKHLRYGVVGGGVGIVVNLLLSLLKAIVGIFFGSIAIVADAANNLTDAASSIITLVGFKLAGKKPDIDHPYGHGRIEYISGLIMAFLVLVLGGSLVKSAVVTIINPEPITFSYITLVILLFSILSKFWLFAFYKKLEKITDSKTFGAAAQDSVNDVISTAAVVVSTLVWAFAKLNIDGYIGFCVSVIILVSGIGLIKDTLDPLLGQPPPKHLVKQINDFTLSYDGVLGIHDLVVHNYGPGRIFASLHAEVCAKQDLLCSHDLIDNIEKDFREKLGLEVVIHIDPVVTDDPKTLQLKKLLQQIIKKIDPRLTLHDFRAVFGPTHTNVIFDLVLPVDIKLSESEIKNQVDLYLANSKENCYAVITFDTDYS